MPDMQCENAWTKSKKAKSGSTTMEKIRGELKEGRKIIRLW
jgi:hypothetical protein